MGSKPNIIIAEDDKLVRTIYMRTLPELLPDYSLYIHEDGQAALSSARNHHPVLVITDINMPRCSGLSLYRGLKQHCEMMRKQLPIFIFCSAVRQALESLDPECKRPPHQRLPKPFPPTRLLDAINEAIGSDPHVG